MPTWSGCACSNRAGWNTIFYPDYDVSAGVPKPPSDPAAADELKRLVEARGGSP